jgi:hypothetical protein
MRRVDAAYVEALRARRGETLGITPWFSVNRTEADAFRIVVGGDKRFGPPELAPCDLHPFHLLALITGQSARLGLPIESDEHFMVLNYGFDYVSFGRAVQAGERVRMSAVLLDIVDRGLGRHLIRRRNTFEAEGEPEPVLVATSLSYWVLS